MGRPDLRLLQHLRFKTTDVYPALLAALIGPDRRLFGTVPPRKILAGPQFSHQLPALPPVYGSRRRLPHEHRFSDDCRLFQPRRPAHRLPPHRNGGSFLTVFIILTVMAYGFGLGAHQIQGQIHDHQTAYTVSQDIKKLNIPDSTPIIMYDYFIPGLVYYLDRPIAAGNFTGELEFGLQHTDRTGMYYSDQELYDLWHSDKPAVIVVEKKYLEEALRVIGTAPARRITDEDYTVLLNGPAARDAAQ